MSHDHRQRGYSLIEVLVAFSILVQGLTMAPLLHKAVALQPVETE